MPHHRSVGNHRPRHSLVGSNSWAAERPGEAVLQRVMSFRRDLDAFIAKLPADSDAAQTLARCRTFADLERLALGQGWIGPEKGGERPRLVMHRNGSFLVVEYEDGWTRTLAHHPIRR